MTRQTLRDPATFTPDEREEYESLARSRKPGQTGGSAGRSMRIFSTLSCRTGSAVSAACSQTPFPHMDRRRPGILGRLYWPKLGFTGHLRPIRSANYGQTPRCTMGLNDLGSNSLSSSMGGHRCSVGRREARVCPGCPGGIALQLLLTPDEAIVLHAALERYLDQVRTDSGRDEIIRPQLEFEQGMLVAVEARLRALAGEAAAHQLPPNVVATGK